MDSLEQQLEMFDVQRTRTYPAKKQKRESLEITRTVISIDLQGYISKTAVSISDEIKFAEMTRKKPNCESVWIRPEHPVSPREFVNIETGETRLFSF